MGASSEPAAGAAAGTGHRWPARAGAWLAIGASPAGLVLGAELAATYGGPAPLAVVLAGAVVMAALLTAQGLLGLARPFGEGATVSELAPRYLKRGSRGALNVLLGIAMIGWFGFNVGLGGAAAAALLGVPGPVGPLILGVPVLAFSFGGLRRWNPLAIVTTLCALALVAVVAGFLAEPESPLTISVGPGGAALTSLAAFVGLVSVVAVRAPDFSVGLATRRDLGWCVALLVGSATCLVAAGIGLQRGTGSTDLVATLARDGGLAVGNLLVAVAVIAPAFTTTYSGSLAIRAVVPVSGATAVLMVAIPGLMLAMTRFDRYLLVWLTVIAAMLPALVIPMAVEAARRRRGRRARLVPLWTFLPASAIAVLLTIAGRAEAPLAGLATAAVLTIVWARVTRCSVPPSPT